MSLIAAIASFVVAILAPGPGVSPHPDNVEPIHILSASQEVTFPSEVLLTLEAEAESDIVEITLFYKLGAREIVTYGYPDFTPSQRVSADFSIKTGGSHYLPTGVEIEYYYVIRDIGGNTLESDRFHVRYVDPRYEWQELSRGSLTIVWHDIPRERVAAVASDVSRRLDDVMDLMGLETSLPMKAVILNRGRDAQLSLPFISEAASHEHLYGGFAFAEYDLFLLLGLNADGMVHEFTHLLMDQAVDSPLARVPSWLNEGLAMYFESGSQRRENVVTRGLEDGRLLHLGSMDSVPGRPSDVTLFYAQSRSVVSYMVGAYGREKMTELLRALDGGQDIDRAVDSVYGRSLDRLEVEWKAWLTGDTVLPEARESGSATVPAVAADTAVEIATAPQAASTSRVALVIVRWTGSAAAVLVLLALAYVRVRSRRRTAGSR